MIVATLAVSWSLLVAAAVVARSPAPRLASRRSRAVPPRAGSSHASTPRARPAVLVGAVIAAAVAAGMVWWPLALAPPAFLATQAVRRRRRSAGAAAARAADVPHLVDLLNVAVGAGLNIRLAVLAVEPYVPGTLGDLWRRVRVEIEAGATTAEALERFAARAGPSVGPVVAALIDSDRYGTAIAPTFDRLASEARAEQCRRSEAAARRVPVALLFPLVLCVLPAFGLLTMAPLIASGLRAVRL